MVQTLKQIKNRIRSITSTRKVTSAMEMIAVNKLNRMSGTLSNLRPFALKLESLFYRLIQGREDIKNPFLARREPVKNTLLCVFTSDNGLCSVYNNNVIRAAEEFIRKTRREKVKLVVIGKKGFSYFKNRGFSILYSYIGLNGRYSLKISDEITTKLCDIFLSGEADEVYLAYTYFYNAAVLKPTVVKFLEIKPQEEQKIDYIFEPDIKGILEKLIPEYISTKMRLVILEAFTSEHASRAVAMKKATDNAEELLGKLVLLRNKVRQANITREILEIISSAEALKG
ncbi:MAG: ATP synthase F1 subunit gamma [Candidatus Omnitrophica bacterium]|nr:ATP synthase F1 subunit gamma [Candidatus Omnitrophota bacterium]